ncbi:NAD(P)-dependent alcohol dehydrogenase [Adhaeribacter sp. BT258]|uniref:NAD(P)-dependent alcohol dehydrogenase n=1 Tax=Adhaeribacter terrigena TaxID=2793070 RepID=A0ABS1C063_9BACT|nr:NAD(P)-dependent alcohol dehydrogenase [Adhaeribacter terrigena]MBK0402807.1 NAD(P)-dependent alcohol dehydrogenase [Adhaeribacter terrigena]
MKAIVCTKYGPPEVLQLQEIEKPVPKANEVLIKIYATTATVADCRVRSFTVPLAFWLPARLILGIRKPKKPVLGAELAGKIEAVGKNVKRFQAGDPVFAATLQNFGAYAEYICLPEAGLIALKPANITYEEAAAIPIGARTALHFLKKGNIQKGQNVLIYGASGSVGTYAVQLAKCFGASVTGVCSGANLDLVKALGADNVIDYTVGDFTQKLEMYDVILVAVDKFPFPVCNRFLKPEGIYLNVTAVVKTLPMLWASLTSKKKIIVGETPPESVEDMNFLKSLVKAGVLKPVLDRSYPLEQIVEAHRYVEKAHKKGNVVVVVHEEV